MSSSIDEFASTAAGAEFASAYDAMLGRWPTDTTVRDVGSRFGTTRLTVCGPADAPSVVALPGGGATSMEWAEVAARLGGENRIIAVDLMGDVGRSVPSERGPRDTSDLVEWFDAVLDAVGRSARPGGGTPTVVGHSYGAMIAVAHALAKPDRLARLVLLEPTSVFAGMRAGYLMRAIPGVIRPTAARLRRFLEWEAGGGLDPVWLHLVGLGAEYFPALRPVVPKRPRAAALAELSVPTTVILAGRSKVHDAERIARIAAGVPAVADVSIVADASHHSVPLVPAAAVADAMRTAVD